MKSILELFAQDKIKVSSRGYQYSKECLKTYEMLEELGGKPKQLREILVL